MSDAAVKRPPILTGACLYLGLLAAVISIRAVTVVSSWNAENRAADVSGALRVLRDAGMAADAAESAYKVLVTVIAVLAAAGAVFAVFTARGDRASRVGMTVTVGIAGFATFVGALGATFFLAMLGALAVVFTVRLWTGEIRTYFRTLAGHPPPPPKVAAPAPAPAPPPAPVPAAAPAQLPAQQPWPPQQAWPAQQPWPPHDPTRREPLPRPVAIAVWTTLISSAVIAAVAGFGVLGLALVGSDDYEQMMRDSPFSRSMIDQAGTDFQQLYRVSVTLLGLFLALSLGGVAASLIALLRHRRGGVFLFVMAVVTAITAFLIFPFGLPWVGLAVLVLVQLSRPESKAWFSRV